MTRTLAEDMQATLTEGLAGPAENLVSTACPNCGVRYAMLAHYDLAGWHLRCVLCGGRGMGTLKPRKETS